MNYIVMLFLFGPMAHAFSWGDSSLTMDQFRNKVRSEQVIRFGSNSPESMGVRAGDAQYSVRSDFLTFVEKICQKGTVFVDTVTTFDRFYCFVQ